MAPKDLTVYMIGNAHIDPVWLWRWQEGFAEVLATCRSALDRMNEFPDFVFTRADAATYKWIEDSCPAMFEEIRARVKEGRWSIVGGWWEQPDCNVPTGESFVRHELYGKRYFLEKFGVDVKVGYNVDSFGHNAGLPQILAKAGISYYVFMRPDPNEKSLPDSVFYWEGPDGSRVLTHRLHAPYCVWAPSIPEHVTASVADRPKGTSVAACFYGVGNHGGGPTVESIELIKRMQADSEAPNLVFGTLEQFMEHVQRERGDFPVVTDDLQHHAVGCYTAHSDMKRWNRQAENALTSAERFCALAKLAGTRGFAKSTFAQAWQNVLSNQFHDILAGTSLCEAYDDTRSALGAAVDAADYEANAALQSIACNVDTSGEGLPFVVFNPHAHQVTAPVLFSQNISGLRDHTGRGVPVQPTAPLFERSWPRATNVFIDTLPPLGYRVYYGLQNTPAQEQDDLSPRADAGTISNGLIEVRIDPQTGRIAAITDIERGTDVLRDAAGPIVMDDASDTWSHGVVKFDKLAGCFADARVDVVENGPVRATLRVESRFGASTILQDISLYRGSRSVEFRLHVDWHEKHRMLKYEFPLDISNPVVTADAAYAVARHPADGAENPCQKWIDVSAESGGGASFANDGSYGYDCDAGRVRLSLLRSPIYAFHDPRQVESGKLYNYMEQGTHSFRFTMTPHAGSWQGAGTAEHALMLNIPPVAVETSVHAGTLPPEHVFISVSEPNIDICTLKEAEDDDALIVRLYETGGQPTDAVLAVAGSEYRVKMGAFELKTLRVGNGKAEEVDLIERAL